MRASVALLGVLCIGLLLALGAACGDDEEDEPDLGPPLSMEEYFAELAALDEALIERTETLDALLADNLAGVGSAEDAFNAARDYVGDAVFIVDQFADGVAVLSPPLEQEVTHEALVDASEGIGNALNALPDQFEGISTAEDVQALFSDAGLAAAAGALRQACTDLQSAAEANGIDVELICQSYEPASV